MNQYLDVNRRKIKEMMKMAKEDAKKIKILEYELSKKKRISIGHDPCIFIEFYNFLKSKIKKLFN